MLDRLLCHRNMGPAEVAAWGMIGYVWSAFETVTGMHSLAVI